MIAYRQRLSPDGVAIFLLHGVVAGAPRPVRNYTRKHIPRDDFAGFLKGLKAAGRALSMDEVLAHLEAGEAFPPNAFAITFDDGFRNNLTVAAPVLADLDIPATFYVTTDFVASNRMSWIDRIEWAVEAVPSVALRLPWAEAVSRASAPAEKRALLDDVRRNVKSNHALDADALATDIQAQCGLPETWSSDDELDRKLDWAEVRELASDSRFIVAGHSHTHPILAFLDDRRLAAELDTSLALLAEKAGIGNVHYAYPEGLAHCYSDRVIEALKARGIRCSPTAEDGINDAATDPFRLRRIFVV